MLLLRLQLLSRWWWLAEARPPFLVVVPSVQVYSIIFPGRCLLTCHVTNGIGSRRANNVAKFGEDFFFPVLECRQALAGNLWAEIMLHISPSIAVRCSSAVSRVAAWRRLLLLLLLLRWCHFNLNRWRWRCLLLHLWLNYHHLLLLWLLGKHSRHLGHQLEWSPGLDSVQPHVRPGQVLHLLLLYRSCNERMSCRRVQHWCPTHV